MKCAVEAVAMSAINKAKNDEAERVRVASLAAQSYKDTLEFIENFISPKLEEQISNGESLKVYVNMGTFYDAGYTFYGMIIPEIGYRGGVVRYANGKASQRIDKSSLINMELLKNELAKYCYQVTAWDYWFKTYGMGDRKGITLCVSPAPQCL